jgi:hypothetical protein
MSGSQHFFSFFLTFIIVCKHNYKMSYIRTLRGEDLHFWFGHFNKVKIIRVPNILVFTAIFQNVLNCEVTLANITFRGVVLFSLGAHG